MSRYDKPEACPELSPEAIQSEVERILASEKFARSKRLRSLLRFTVAQTLQGNADTLKEYVIGTEVLKKPDSYDPRSDSLVRVLASRLRVKLKEYYSDGGSEDPLVIEFPKGKYVPRFQRREQLQTEIEKKLRARNACSLGKFLMSRLSESTLAQAAQHFEEAIEADPSWPAAHEGLASVYAFQAFLGFRRPREAWPLARAQAETTLQLDEMSAEAHLCLGLVYAFFEWRWRDAESHFHKAMERDSYSGAGHLWRALACLVPLGKMVEAREEVARAQELAVAPFLEEGHALVLFFAEQYEEVLKLAERRSATGKVPGWMPWMRACALAATGQAEKAIEILEGLHQESPQARIAATLAGLYGLAGRLDRGRELLTAIQARGEHGEWLGSYEIAIAETGLGNRYEALTALQEGIRDRDPWIVFLQCDPRFATLRENPKFAGFVRRVLLTEEEATGAGRRVE
jgi:tetratricopeptide (TPR) repeat protein